MATRLRAGLLARVRTERMRANRPRGEVDAHVDALENLLAGTDFTGLALESLEENFFEPALNAIEHQFTGQLLVKARLLQTLATTLNELGLRDAASATA